MISMIKKIMTSVCDKWRQILITNLSLQVYANNDAKSAQIAQNYRSLFFTHLTLVLVKNVLEYLHHRTDTPIHKLLECHGYAVLVPGLYRG